MSRWEISRYTIKVTNDFIFEEKTTYYNEFLSKIYEEFKKMIVPNLIMVPLNNFNIDFGKKDYIILNDYIRIFSQKMKCSCILGKKNKFSY